MTVDQVLLLVHFIGLTLGFSTGFANLTMAGLLAAADPAEKAVLGRFPPAMSRLGRLGLLLLWASGLVLLYKKWGGFAYLPWTFHVKIGAVVLLTATTEHIHALERRARAGNPAAASRIEPAGKVAMALALVALALAVVTFN